MIFKNLKTNIAAAIKQSCYKLDARLYNIANQIPEIKTSSIDPEVENEQGLSKIIDRTIKDSVGVGCDLSVIIKGIFIGAFRSCPSDFKEIKWTINILTALILSSVFKYKGDLKHAIEGILAGGIVTSKDFKFNEKETMITIKEGILYAANAINSKFADDIKKVLPKLDEL